MKKSLFIFFRTLIFLTAFEVLLRLGGFFQDLENYIHLNGENQFKILCVGDSMTASPYPGLLEKYLNSHQRKINIVVINKGIPSATTDLIAEKFQGFVDQYKPQLAICMVGGDDRGQGLPKEEPAKSAIPNNTPMPHGLVAWWHLTQEYFSTKEGRIRTWALIANRYADLTSADKPAFVRMYERLGRQIHLYQNVNDRQAWIDWGMYLLDSKEYNAADAAFEKAESLEDKHKDYDMFANAFLEKSSYQQAAKWYERYLADRDLCLIENRMQYPVFELAYCYRKLNRMTDAEKLLEDTLAMPPTGIISQERLFLYFNLADLYFEENRYDMAEKMLVTIIQENLLFHWHWSKITFYLKALKVFEHRHDQANIDKINVLLRQESQKFAGDYNRIANIALKEGVQLVVLSYPMLDADNLRRYFSDAQHVMVIESKKPFIDAGADKNYFEFFADHLGSEYGHCTLKGYKVFSEHIGQVLLKDYFKI